MSLVADPVMPASAVAGLQSDVEALPREALAALQFERLQATLRNAYDHVPWQQARLKAAGYSGESGLVNLDDLRHLPFTVKTDLRDNYPFGLFTGPVGELARLHASSGTTGKPTVVGYTAQTSTPGPT
jgi:phenylacetate-CoA ligase